MQMKRLYAERSILPRPLKGGGLAFLRPTWRAVLVDVEPDRPHAESERVLGFFPSPESGESWLREHLPSVPFVWEPVR